jgi:hypothetical protein
MKHVHTFESFLNESALLEGKYPIPSKWDEITPARYKQEIEFMKRYRDMRSREERATKKAEMGRIAISDYKRPNENGEMMIPLVDGTRPPIVDTKQIGNDHIISKSVVTGINSSDVIGTPISLGNFEVAQFDLPGKMNWWEAEYSCVQLGGGWYLPDKKQIEAMMKSAEAIGLKIGYYYWGGGNPRTNNGVFSFGTKFGGINTVDMTSAGQQTYLCRPVR